MNSIKLNNGGIAFIFPKEKGQLIRNIIGYIIYLNNDILKAEKIETIKVETIGGMGPQSRPLYIFNDTFYYRTSAESNKVPNKIEIQKIYGLELSKSWWKKNKYIEHNNIDKHF